MATFDPAILKANEKRICAAIGAALNDAATLYKLGTFYDFSGFPTYDSWEESSTIELNSMDPLAYQPAQKYMASSSQEAINITEIVAESRVYLPYELNYYGVPGAPNIVNAPDGAGDCFYWPKRLQTMFPLKQLVDPKPAPPPTPPPNPNHGIPINDHPQPIVVPVDDAEEAHHTGFGVEVNTGIVLLISAAALLLML